MATVEIAFISPVGDDIDSAAPSSVQILTSSASNQVSTGAADAREICVITASGGNIYAPMNAAPNATSDANRRLILDGQTRAFAVNDGYKCAIVDL